MTSPKIIYHTLFALLVLSFESVKAQFTFTEDHSIEVKDQDGRLLVNAWAGGLNSAQFNTMDFDFDGHDDLVLFDRMANIVMPFLNVGGQYKYAPEYTVLFPAEVTNWLLLRDFNCDGKKDIFTGDIMGGKVYINTSDPEQGLSWKAYMFWLPNVPKTNIILTKGSVRKNSLQMQYDDLPAVVDADGDGDMDMFTIRYGGYGMAEYHKNYSMERYSVCDSLDFERLDNWHGGFTQCKCENFVFNNEICDTGGRVDLDVAGRVQHAAGKGLLVLDVDNDGDRDVIFSEAECDNLYLLMNKGTTENTVFNTVELFPHTEEVRMKTFPVGFLEDVDQDGVKDLVVTPNSYRKEFLSNPDYRSSTWFYKNVGSNEFVDFTLVKKNLLQEDMIDVGDNAVPAFADQDGDGDLDLFIGYSSGKALLSGLFYFENMGSGFQLRSENYNNLESLGLYNLKPQFVDVNGDQKQDLVFSASTNAAGDTFIFYLLNTADKGLQFSNGDLFKINVAISFTENFLMTDIDHDGNIDVLIGTYTGSIRYWRNRSSVSPDYYRADDKYLNFSMSTIRQSIAMCAADLNNDGKEDLIVADQDGRLGILNDFHETRAVSVEFNDFVLNPITNEYHPTRLGRVWPTTATLFDSKRPAIIAGTIRGGLHVFRNEDKELSFEELILSVYPNPVTEGIVSIKTNLPATLHVIAATGQEVTASRFINVGTTTLDLSRLAKGMYILKFITGNRLMYRRIIVR